MNSQSMIAAYNTGFNICLTIAVLGAASAIFLFFKFDIRTIFAIRTGRAERQTVEKLREANARTGTLRPAPEIGYTTDGLTAEPPPAPETAPLAPETTPLAPATAPPAEPAPAAADATTPLPPGFRFVITENTMIVHSDEIL